jgi:hypothetical protein
VLVPPAPVLVEAPLITGGAAVGETLTVSTGTWQATPPPTLAYAWQRCDEAGSECVPIPGATAASYTVTAEDAGQTLVAVVTATSRGRSTSARAVGVVVQPR